MPGFLAALGLSAASQIGNTAFNAIYNSPKKQIERLKAAGLSANAIYSGVNTGNITTNMSLGSPSELLSGINEGKKFREGSMVGQQVDDLDSGAPLGSNLRIAERFVDMTLKNSQGFGARAGARKADQDVKTGIATEENVRADTAYKGSQKKNLEADTNLKTDEMKTRKLDRQMTRVKIRGEELSQALQVLDIEGKASENEIKAMEAKYQEQIIALDIMLKEGEIDINSEKINNLRKDLLVKGLALQLGVGEKQIMTNKVLMSDYDEAIQRGETRAARMRADLIQQDWTVKNSSAKAWAHGVNIVEESLKLIGTPLKGLFD